MGRRWLDSWSQDAEVPEGAPAADASPHASFDARGSKCSPRLSGGGSAPALWTGRVCAAPAGSVKKRRVWRCSVCSNDVCMYVWKKSAVSEMTETVAVADHCMCISFDKCARLKLTRRSVSVFSSRAVMVSTGEPQPPAEDEALAWISFSPASVTVNDRGFRGFSSFLLLLGGDYSRWTNRH